MRSEKVFDGRLIKLFKSYIRLPDGRKGYFEEIRHPGAALVVPFTGDCVVFIRQYRPVIGKYIWELPAGTLNPGETPYSCAKREVTEETGYAVSDLKRIGTIYSSPGFCDEVIHIFRADCIARGTHNRDTDEFLSVRRIRTKNVKSLFQNKRISDSKTIAALAFAGLLG
ncbi:MAG: NUDIX hydrolase [Candidatus Omnitrophica bacterium]|nr:NUDIX hydrolase [Candidatus Omnitrophota bacterium]